MNRLLRYLFFFSIAFLFTACSNKNLEEMNPGAFNPIPCNIPDTITYVGYVQPLMVTRCGATDVNCHDQNSNQTVLSDYIETKQRAESGALMGSIQHLAGLPAMPKGLPKLDDCTISKIQKWVNDGTPEN